MMNNNMSWVNIRENSPVDINRVIGYAQNFESLVNVRITIYNLDKAKRALLEARSNLDLMITTLLQLMSDRTFIKKREDEVLYYWLVDNLGRVLKKIDEREDTLVINWDYPKDPRADRVGVSALSAYSKLLKTSSQSLVYETLLKAINEYKNFEETPEIKKELRTFYYILFNIMQVTLSAMGGMTREKTQGIRKGQVNSVPFQWQTLMSSSGQKVIRDRHKEETGEDIKDVPLELIDRAGNSVTVIESDEEDEEDASMD